MENLYIITTSDLPNYVILGHAEFSKAAGFNPVFVFPDRGNGEKYINAYSNYKINRLNVKFNVNNYLTYILSIIKLFFALTSKFLFQKSNCNFLIVDFECNIASIFLKSKRNKIISLINDNFSIRYKFPKILFLVIRYFESATYFRLVCMHCTLQEYTSDSTSLAIHVNFISI